MKKNRISIVIFNLVLVILLSACGILSNESSVNLDNQSQNNHSTKGSNDNFTNENSFGNESDTDNMMADNDTNKTDDVSNKEEELTVHKTDANLKERYLKKLSNSKKETEALEATDSSTYALKKVENERWEIWDQLLNEIYGELNENLPSEEMAQLREEQRNWIKYRDDSALKASQKYKGGTQEHLEYVSVLANLTEQRCYELVEYM